MRSSFVEIARCPCCRAERSFDLAVDAEDGREVRDGTLTCSDCGERRTIGHGIVDLMAPDPPAFVRREAAGLARFAERMRNDGWDRERILRLPGEPSEYWYGQRMAMRQILETLALEPGARILDVGSNTCWASATFAANGLEPIALDITTTPLQGLETADWWIEDRDVYFERALGVMFDVPLATDSLDYVFCCEVLHHNDRANLRRTLAELRRVLRPGGRLLVVNETLRALLKPQLRPGREVAEFEGHEHAFLRRTYVKAARDAGFQVELLAPWTVPILHERLTLDPDDCSTLGGYKLATLHAVRRNPGLRRGYLAWKAYVTGDVGLFMVATA